jgi:hypothetical protein
MSLVLSDCDEEHAQQIVSFEWDLPDEVRRKQCVDGFLPGITVVSCAYAPVQYHLGALSLAFCSLGAAACLAMAIAIIYFRKHKVVRSLQWKFSAWFALGLVVINLCCMSLVGQNTDFTCMMRPWLINLSLVFAFVPLFLKTRRVYKIFTNPRMKRVIITDGDMIRFSILIIGADIIILTIWTVIAPVKAIPVEVGIGFQTTITQNLCSSDNDVFAVVAAVFIGGLLGWGSYLAFAARNVPTDFAEAKNIMFTCYNVTFVCAIVAMVYFLFGIAVETQVLLVGIGALWGTVSSGLMIFGPTFWRIAHPILSKNANSKYADSTVQPGHSTLTDNDRNSTDGSEDELRERCETLAQQNTLLKQQKASLMSQIKHLQMTLVLSSRNLESESPHADAPDVIVAVNNGNLQTGDDRAEQHRATMQRRETAGIDGAPDTPGSNTRVRPLGSSVA